MLARLDRLTGASLSGYEKSEAAKKLRELLAGGADPDAKNGNGESALRLAIVAESQELVRPLLEAGATASGGPGRIPALCEAAKRGLEDVAAALLEFGADPWEKEGLRGWTALHFAAWEGNAEVAELLMRAGADPNATNAAGATPLHFAAKARPHRGNREMEEMVLRLLEGGADPSLRDSAGETPRSQAKGELAALMDRWELDRGTQYGARGAQPRGL